MRTGIWAVAAILTLALFVSAGAAERANPNRGKSFFRATCKTCHIKGGGAKDLSPLTKTQAQWTRAFKSSTVDTMVTRVQSKTGTALTRTDLTDIQTFLVAHAADSDQPETCGLK